MSHFLRAPVRKEQGQVVNLILIDIDVWIHRIADGPGKVGSVGRHAGNGSIPEYGAVGGCGKNPIERGICSPRELKDLNRIHVFAVCLYEIGVHSIDIYAVHALLASD